MLACNWSMATRAASAHAAVRPGQLLGSPLKLRRSVLHLPRGARQRRHRLRDVGEARAQILADQLRHHLRPDAIAYVLRQLDNPVFQLPQIFHGGAIRGVHRLHALLQHPRQLLAFRRHLPGSLLDEQRQELHGAQDAQHFVALRQHPAVRHFAVIVRANLLGQSAGDALDQVPRPRFATVDR